MFDFKGGGVTCFDLFPPPYVVCAVLPFCFGYWFVPVFPLSTISAFSGAVIGSQKSP